MRPVIINIIHKNHLPLHSSNTQYFVSKLMVCVHKFKKQLSKVVSTDFKAARGVLELTLERMNN